MAKVLVKTRVMPFKVVRKAFMMAKLRKITVSEEKLENVEILNLIST
jgi:hypothetical protein